MLMKIQLKAFLCYINMCTFITSPAFSSITFHSILFVHQLFLSPFLLPSPLPSSSLCKSNSKYAFFHYSHRCIAFLYTDQNVVNTMSDTSLLHFVSMKNCMKTIYQQIRKQCPAWTNYMMISSLCS